MKLFKGIVALALVCTLLVGCGLNGMGAKETQYEGDGFKTAEDAATSFVEGLRDLNFDKMLKSYAWETQAEHYKYDGMLRRFRAFNPAFAVKLPSDNEFYVSSNVVGLHSKESGLLYMAISYYVMSDDIEFGVNIPLKDDDDINEFLDIYNNEKYKDFTNIKNIRFSTPEEMIGSICPTEEYNKRVEIEGDCYGADEVVCVAVLADVGDKTFYYFPTVARYGEKWYIVSSWSVISEFLGMSAHHPFVITDEAPQDWETVMKNN